MDITQQRLAYRVSQITLYDVSISIHDHTYSRWWYSIIVWATSVVVRTTNDDRNHCVCFLSSNLAFETTHKNVSIVMAKHRQHSTSNNSNVGDSPIFYKRGDSVIQRSVSNADELFSYSSSLIYMFFYNATTKRLWMEGTYKAEQ